MPKKSKRRTSKSINRAAQSPATTQSVAQMSAANKPFEFNPDYSYVIKDLRRIGALAGTFVVILVILSFILN